MSHKFNFKDYIIIALCVILIFMGIGYASVARLLVIRSVTRISTNKDFNVLITSIELWLSFSISVSEILMHFLSFSGDFL